jgi:multiple sugar transport system permease protein
MAAEVNNKIKNNKRKNNKRKWKSFWFAMLFVSPFTIGFLLFGLYPIIMALYYSFTDFSLLKAPQWVGLANYTSLFKDPFFLKAILNKIYLMLFGVPLGVVVSLSLAVLLNNKVPGANIFRTIIYMPSVVPAVASALLWVWMLNPNYGLINTILGFIGIKGPGWFADPNWSKPAILLMMVWGTGFSMVIFLASLQDIPDELKEAARLDGANSFQVFLHVTVPLISNVTFFIIITNIVSLSQFFTQAYVINGGNLGAPASSTLFYGVYLYQNGFSFLKMGYASAMAWFLLLFSLAATWVLLRYSDTYRNK